MNRKLYLVFLLTYKVICFGQIEFNSNPISTPNILPPDVSSFQKVNFLPVSNYTGRAKIDISFHEINLEGLKIPISLSYNTGGIKSNDISSSVGLNWSLNTGGIISKTTQDVDDFRVGIAESYDWEQHITSKYSPHGWLSYYTKFTPPAGTQITGRDNLPDIFNVSAPGLNLSFTHNVASHLPYNNGYIEPFARTEVSGYLPNGNLINLTNPGPYDASPFIIDSDNSIEIEETYGTINTGAWGIEMGIVNSNTYDCEFFIDGGYLSNAGLYGINKFKIKSDKGFEYIFDKIDSSQYVYNRDTNPIGTYNTLAHNLSVSSYHLSKIIDTKTTNYVEFEYEAYVQGFSEIIDNTDIVNYYNTQYTTSTMNSKGLWMKQPKLNRLKKIYFKEGTIEFNYDLLREDVPGEKALTSIVLFDNNHNQIKKMNLVHDYYITNYSQITPFSKRLKLKEVVEFGINSSDTGHKYKLTYDSNSLPLRNLAVSDLFGYNNGESNKFNYDYASNQYVLLPPYNNGIIPKQKIYFTPNKGNLSFFPQQLFANSILCDGNYELTSNFDFCKAGILEKIEYPTGGFISLEYELNKYKLNNIEVNGGGLRIKKQIISDGISSRILKYEYINEDGLTSGVIAGVPKKVKFYYSGNNAINNNLSINDLNSLPISLHRFNTNKSNVELTEGAYVGYSKVKVYEENLGSTLYEYITPNEYPNENGNFLLYNNNISPCATSINTIVSVLKSNGQEELNFNKDHFRGKIKSEKLFNQSNLLLKEKKYEYESKTFKELVVARSYIDNPITCNYSQPQEVTLEYGQFRQNRFLLNKVIDIDYFGNSQISKTTSFKYNDNYSLVTEETITFPLNTINKKYYYPFDSEVSNLPYMQNLVQQHRINEPVKEIVYKNNQIISTIQKNFSLFQNFIQVPNGFFSTIVPINSYLEKSVSKSKGNGTLEEDLIVSIRDNLGNIVELKDTQNNYTTIIWGYNKTQPVAKVENMAYANIPANIITNIQNASNGTDEQTLLNTLTVLRNAPALANAMITTITYKPLIGVSTITDTKGDKQTYHYDSFNRLQFVKDSNGNILSENEYHYKN